MHNIIVPMSGGKDSQLVLDLALKKYKKEKIICVHQNTGYDHPDTYNHIKFIQEFYGINVVHTYSKYGDMFGFLEKVKYFPCSGARGCTQRLKQEPFAAWLVKEEYNEDNCVILFGMRTEESKNRKSKYGGLSPDDFFLLEKVSAFYGKEKHKFLGKIKCLAPIVDWTTFQVFEYFKEEGTSINPLYGKGHHRVGCYPCFLGRKQEWISAGKDPVGIERIKRMMEIEKKWRIEGNPRKYIKVHPKWDVRNFLN